MLSKDQTNEKGKISDGGVAVYKQHQFPVRIALKPNQFCYVQDVLSASDATRNETAVIEYDISTETHLLIKEIQMKYGSDRLRLIWMISFSLIN